MTGLSKLLFLGALALSLNAQAFQSWPDLFRSTQEVKDSVTNGIVGTYQGG